MNFTPGCLFSAAYHTKIGCENVGYSKISQTRKIAIPTQIGSQKWSFLLLRNLECSWLPFCPPKPKSEFHIDTRTYTFLFRGSRGTIPLAMSDQSLDREERTKNEERRREKPSVLSKKPTRLTRCGAKKAFFSIQTGSATIYRNIYIPTPPLSF